MSKAMAMGVIAAFLVSVAPVAAQQTSAPAVGPEVSSSVPAPELPAADQAMVDAWQGVISSQIEAFRTHDAPGALKLASAEFHKSFTDPERFYAAIIGSGYGPIAQSRGESFGPYQLVTADTALQDVKLTGADQAVYEAIYQMVKEADGWRVSGVQLRKTPAIGV